MIIEFKGKRPLSADMQTRLAHAPQSYVKVRQDYLDVAQVIE